MVRCDIGTAQCNNGISNVNNKIKIKIGFHQMWQKYGQKWY